MRVAIYYNHYNTMGHSTRVLALVRALRRHLPGCRVLVLEGGETPDLLPLRRHARVVPLPHSVDKRGFYVEEVRRIYQRMVASGKLDRMLRERLTLMRRTLSRFRPDIFITEYFPFGQEFWTFEVPYLLDFVKQELGARVVGSAGYVCYMEGAREIIQNYYDLLMVHAPEPFALAPVRGLHPEPARRLAGILTDFRDRIRFTGFVCDLKAPAGTAALRQQTCGRRFKASVFVSRGGGIVNNRSLLVPILAARRLPEIFFTVCCGPSSPPGEVEAFARAAAGQDNVRLVPAMPPALFDRHLAAADACVATTGYNTALKLLYFGKPAVLVPYVTTEQRGRAALLQEHLPAVVLADKDLSVARMVESLGEVLARRNEPRPSVAHWFDGGRETAALLEAVR